MDRTTEIGNATYSTGGMIFMDRSGIIDVASSGVRECGTLDETYFKYDGNRLVQVDVLTNATTFEGRRGIPRKTSDMKLTYTDKGEVDRDDTRRIVHTEWRRGYPSRMYLAGGHRHDMVRDGMGNLVSMTYNVSTTPVVAGQISDEVVRTGTRRYTGDGHVLRNDTVMVQRFGGGYFDEDCKVHYYVVDYLGSNVAVLGSDGSLEQRTEYYPYGEPLEQPQGANRFLHGGKEYLDADGRNEYFYEARYTVPSLCIMTSQDPLRHKYPWLSPYLFCASNPVNFIDPTGCDVYSVDSNGHISFVDKNTECDMVIASNNKCVELEYGTILKFDGNLCWGYANGTPIIMDVFKVRGDDNGTKLFEFLADNTSVEFTQLKTGEKGENGLNFVSTSHSTDSEGSGPMLIDKMLKHGYTIREDIHSHPEGTDNNPVHVNPNELRFEPDHIHATQVNGMTNQKISYYIYRGKDADGNSLYDQYYDLDYYRSKYSSYDINPIYLEQRKINVNNWIKK